MSDLTFLLKRPEVSVAPLEKFLRFEQKNVDLWSRLARAYYEIGRTGNHGDYYYKKAIEALGMQLSLEESPSVLNNLGVVYAAQRQITKAQRLFAKSFLSAKEKKEDLELSLSNLLTTYIELKEYKTAYRISKDFVAHDNYRNTKNEFVSKIYLQHIVSLEALGHRSEAAERTAKLIERGISNLEVKIDLITHLIVYKTLIDPDETVIDNCLNAIPEDIESLEDISDRTKVRAINNIVFALLQFDRLSESEKYIKKLTKYVSVDPFATATFGLYKIKKGAIDQAKKYYLQAVSMTVDSAMKEKIRQRMNIELGKAMIVMNREEEALSYLKKAIQVKGGLEYATESAKKLIKKIKS